MFNTIMAGIMAATLMMAASAAFATDQTRPVRDVIIADVNGDLDGFLDRMKRVKGVADRLKLPVKMQVFMGTFAGEHNGDIFLYWELPSFIEFAEAETAIHQDAEFLSILAEMDAAGQSFKTEFLTIEITKY